ncbi:MAG TPA: ATP-binding cassette domain-containing protein [Dehalococcoidia bacterium]|nr:ATP-binding cassette domain-containing protein [Dehalococcoidia bacterium]
MPASMGDSAVVVHGAAVRLGGRTIWQDVNLAIPRGSFTAILGPNGAGKSTLLKAVLGLQPLVAGEIRVLGKPPGSGNRRVGYLPQRRSFDASLRIRGVDIVRLGLDGSRWGVPLPRLGRFCTQHERAARRRVSELIALVGGTAYAGRPIGQLSGGEQQRLLIAQALARRPELLLLDEPLESLDISNQGAIAALIQQICREQGVTVLMVAHDVNPIVGYLDQVVYVARGNVVTGTVQQVITTETLSRLYATRIEVLTASDGRLVVVGEPAGAFDAGGHGAHATR